MLFYLYGSSARSSENNTGDNYQAGRGPGANNCFSLAGRRDSQRDNQRDRKVIVPADLFVWFYGVRPAPRILDLNVR